FHDSSGFRSRRAVTRRFVAPWLQAVERFFRLYCARVNEGRQMIRRIVAFSTLMAVGGGVAAHHSFAPHFDASKPVDITGTVLEYEARNPHSYLHIAAVDENGRTQEYVCESHGTTQLTRNGIG